MKHFFGAPTAWLRSVFAAAAVVSTLFVIGWIDGLAQHYSPLGAIKHEPKTFASGLTGGITPAELAAALRSGS